MFKYEMHCHTKEISKCGAIDAVPMIDFYKSVDIRVLL